MATYSRTQRLTHIGLILLIGYLLWPMLKGQYYKNFSDSSQSAIAWRTDFAQAIQESEATGKPLLLDFSADWCPPCQVMKHETWTDQRVGEAVEKGYIPVLVDVDRPENRSLSKRYEISSIPAILVLSPELQPVRSTSFASAGAMLEFLQPREL